MNEPPIDSMIDQLCDRFEREYKAGHCPQIECFLAEIDSEHRTNALYWLRRTEDALRKVDVKAIPTVELSEGSENVESTVECDLQSGFAEKNFPIVPGYELLGLVGKGGQGEVYEATQLRTGQKVALKFVERHPLPPRNDEATQALHSSYKSEAGIVAMLRHPNAIRLYDGGWCQAGPYLVMELVRGGNLTEERKQFNQFEAAELVRRIAEAVAQAHAIKILHLDIKPQNILFDEQTSQPRLVDFGLAKMEAARIEAIDSDVNTVAGTPGFMAPEQASCGPLDERTDVFGLGATLFYLLTGRRPIEGSSVGAIIKNSIHPAIKPPSSWNPNVNRAVEQICMKCLAVCPEDRYQNAEQLVKDLSRLNTKIGAQLSIQMANGFLVVALATLVLNFVTAALILNRAPEHLVWLSAFSIYIPFLSVFYLYPAPTAGSQLNTQEAIWAIWIGKLIGEVLTCIALRLVVDDLLIAYALAYPVFLAFSGMAVCSLGFHFWNRFYLIACCYWFTVPFAAYLTSMNAAWGPVIYASTSLGVIVYALHLKRVTREVRQAL